MKQFFLMICLLFILLFFHEETITGARNGLLLWYQTLIPSLLPFILVTNALAETNAYQAAARSFHRYIPYNLYEKIAILLGNLCGYPIGGKILNDFVNNQYVSWKQANSILSVSSQASPMFLVGYVYTHVLDRSLPLSVFLGSIYFPTFVLAFVRNRQSSLHSRMSFSPLPSHKFRITDTFLHSSNIIIVIGIYVMAFSILLEILHPLCRSPYFTIPLSGLEITTGLQLLKAQASLSFIRIPLICSLASFGGLCSAFQIRSVLSYEKASIKKYLLDKCLLSAGTFLLTYGYLFYINTR